jgi:hypothetical protein
MLALAGPRTLTTDFAGYRGTTGWRWQMSKCTQDHGPARGAHRAVHRLRRRAGLAQDFIRRHEEGILLQDAADDNHGMRRRISMTWAPPNLARSYVHMTGSIGDSLRALLLRTATSAPASSWTPTVASYPPTSSFRTPINSPSRSRTRRQCRPGSWPRMNSYLRLMLA